MSSENYITPSEYIAKLREKLILKIQNVELEIRRDFDEISKLVNTMEKELVNQEGAPNEQGTIDPVSATPKADI